MTFAAEKGTEKNTFSVPFENKGFVEVQIDKFQFTVS